MSRNYFSKQSGPYFLNDGFTHHNDLEPGYKGLFITIGFVTLFVFILIVAIAL